MSTKAFGGTDNDALLMQQFFLYIARLLNDHDGHRMHRLNLRPEQSCRISKMTTTDLLALAGLGGHCIQFSVNTSALDEVFKQLDQQNGKRQLIDRCILADAPNAMMNYFFGMSGRQYSNRRQAQNVPVCAGRDRLLTEHEATRVYQHYIEQGKQFLPAALLKIAEETGIALRLIWNEINQIQLDARGKSNDRTSSLPIRSLSATPKRI